MEFLRSYGCHFERETVVAPRNAACFLKLLTPSLSEILNRFYCFLWQRTQNQKQIITACPGWDDMANTWLAAFPNVLGPILRSVCRYVSIGVLHWHDLDQEQRSEITWFILDQRNRQIHSGIWKISSFDVLWSEWSRITSLIRIILKDSTL